MAIRGGFILVLAKGVSNGMNRSNLQIQAAVSLLLEFLLEQKDILLQAIDVQRGVTNEESRTSSGNDESHSASSVESPSFDIASGSSRTNS